MNMKSIVILAVLILAAATLPGFAGAQPPSPLPPCPSGSETWTFNRCQATTPGPGTPTPTMEPSVVEEPLPECDNVRVDVTITACNPSTTSTKGNVIIVNHDGTITTEPVLHVTPTNGIAVWHHEFPCMPRPQLIIFNPHNPRNPPETRITVECCGQGDCCPPGTICLDPTATPPPN